MTAIRAPSLPTLRMLKGCIKLDDLNNPVSSKGRDLFFGDSYIKPFTHSLLEHAIIERPDGFDFLTYEKSLLVCDIAFEQWKTQGSFSDLQLALESAGVDYLFLRTSASLRLVQLTAGQIGAAPIYITLVDGVLWLDWSISEVIKHSTRTLDPVHASSFLTGKNDYGTHTLFRDVYRVAAGTRFDVSDRVVNISHAEPAPGLTVSPLEEGADPRALLFRGMRAVFQTRPFDAVTTAAEISGGMDSAIAALALSDAYGPGLRSSGAIFAGEMGAAQQSRRQLIIAKGGYVDLPIDATKHAPYGADSVRRAPLGVYADDENYPELFEFALSQLREAGVDTLISGQGGDELYPCYSFELDRPPPSEPKVGKLLTGKTHELAAQRAKTYPNLRLLQSCWVSAAGRAERSLRHGIWPIYVYHTPQVTSFTFRLPLQWREKRTLHKRTLTWLLDDDVFETDYVKETFRPLYVQGVMENQESLRQIFNDSCLADMGLVDADEISKVIADPEKNEKEMRSLFFILNLEFYVRNGSVSIGH